MSQVACDSEEARAEIEAILSSRSFTPSGRPTRLLRYLYAKMCQGDAANLKEYTIGVEEFNKPQDFEQYSDSTVRVEAHRLRKKLEKYYENEGRGHAIRVILPAGQYILEFKRRADGAEEVPPAVPPSKAGGAQGVRRWVNLWLLTAVAALVLAAGALWLGYYLGVSSPKDERLAQITTRISDESLPDPDPDAIRILVGRKGSPYVDAAGRRWGDDRYFKGGRLRAVNRPSLPGTSRPELFQTVREGDFDYRIPLPPGEYELRLYFADPDGPGSDLNPERRWRIMSVFVNDKELMKAYDLPAEVGVNADVRVFAHLQPDSSGILAVQFYSARGGAVVSAIEVLPMKGGKPRPLQIIAQRQPYKDVNGVFWSPDDYFLGGKISPYTAMLQGDVDPGIVSGERYGDFEYRLPVADGPYSMTLYMGEGWFGPKNPGGGGVGTRVFDVLLDRRAALDRFDMLREAEPNQVIAKTLSHVRPDGSGKIRLTFTPRVNFAAVRAIQVLPED